ncbi:MAG: glycine zipper 2TM domain-containing protein [Pseudomonadota bacterium]
MKHTHLAWGLALLTLTVSPLSLAKDKGWRDDYDYARVIDVDPVYETTYVSTPRRECYEEPVTRHRSANDSYTGIIAGGIVGGVLGNQVGKGRGKDVATVAGTLLGGSIGRDLTRGDDYAYTSYERRCDVVEDYHERERVSGYRVKYRYDGDVYTTYTDHHPGARIRVKVTHGHHHHHHHYYHDD